MSITKDRTIVSFEVRPELKQEFQEAFKPFDLNISEGIRETLRRLLDMSEAEKVNFARDAKIHDTRDVLIERGLWDSIKSYKSK